MNKKRIILWKVCTKCPIKTRINVSEGAVHNGEFICFKCQPDMFSQAKKESYPEIVKVTDEAIERGYSHADSEWRAMALDCLHHICLNNETFTVNDVRDIVKMSSLKTQDNRAMGGVIKRGVANKWMEATGKTIPSLVGHKVHIQIWKSLIVKK